MPTGKLAMEKRLFELLFLCAGGHLQKDKKAIK
jgi:hypothetical protein